jgi:hypothetical protein
MLGLIYSIGTNMGPLMIRKMFNWQNWIAADDGSYTFFDCKLLTDIGPHKAGTIIDRIDGRASGKLIINNQVYNVDPITIKPR